MDLYLSWINGGESTSEKVINYTNDFWDVVECYFLGKLSEKVNSTLNK